MSERAKVSSVLIPVYRDTAGDGRCQTNAAVRFALEPLEGAFVVADEGLKNLEAASVVVL